MIKKGYIVQCWCKLPFISYTIGVFDNECVFISLERILWAKIDDKISIWLAHSENGHLKSYFWFLVGILPKNVYWEKKQTDESNTWKCHMSIWDINMIYFIESFYMEIVLQYVFSIFVCVFSWAFLGVVPSNN